MIPRQRLDIGWCDMAHALAASVFCRDSASIAAAVEAQWDAGRTALACLSVRSGFDALLTALDLAPGDEVLVSAVTIGDMQRIIEAHGLVATPADIDPGTLGVDEGAIRRKLTPRTRAILVAHLFGSRMPMEPVLKVAREYGLLVIEDCAQAYAGPGFRGSDASDVCLFSFGPIKTATALGGAVLSFRRAALAASVRAVQSAWPHQRGREYLFRVCRFAALMLLAHRGMFTLFYWVCRMLGANHDQIICRSVRGFAGDDFFARIRRRPSPALIRVLARRLVLYEEAPVAARAERARQAALNLASTARPGDRAAEHTHWVFPILHDRPDELMRHLWRHGFDATRGGSNLVAIAPTVGGDAPSPCCARAMLARLVYLPLHAKLSPGEVARLASAVKSFESPRTSPALASPAAGPAASVH